MLFRAAPSKADFEREVMPHLRLLHGVALRMCRCTGDAEDLVQAFFARRLEKNFLASVDSERGKFRAFLLASLKHFLAHEWEKARAQKRGGRAHLISLDLDTAEGERDQQRLATGPQEPHARRTQPHRNDPPRPLPAPSPRKYRRSSYWNQWRWIMHG